jgi:DNA polymerase sigma
VWPAWRAVYYQLADLLQRRFLNGVQLHVFGSLIQNIPRNTSDLDLCLVLDPTCRPTLTRRRQQDHIRDLGQFLAAALRTPVTTITQARVPIVACQHFDISLHFEGVVNSHWIRGYVDANPELVQPLSTVLLSWIAAAGIKNNRNGYFSSYTVTLLLLYYLLTEGHVAHRPVRRRTEALAPHNFPPFLDRTLADPKALDLPLLGRCLVGFFEFYLHRFSMSHVIQFLTPPAERTLQQHQKGWRSTLAIEDPFEPEFNPARNIVPDTWAVIRREMERAYHSLFEEPATPFFTLTVESPTPPTLELHPSFLPRTSHAEGSEEGTYDGAPAD